MTILATMATSYSYRRLNVLKIYCVVPILFAATVAMSSWLFCRRPLLPVFLPLLALVVQLAKPYKVKKQQLEVSVSIGVAIPTHGNDVDTLLRSADKAMPPKPLAK